MKKFIPLVGMPRSGSTLLMNILNENNIFTTLADSDLPELLNSVYNWSAEKIKISQLPHQNFQESVLEFCRSGSDSWFNNNCPTEFLIDKSRYWIYQHHFMFKIFPDMKIILNIRDLRFVVDSFLKAEENTFCVNFQTYYQNMHENFMVQRIRNALDKWYLKGFLLSLKELIEISPKYLDQILIVKYEDFVANPQNSLNRIYEFLELPSFNHDFDNIKKIEPHYDNMYLPYGSHQIKTKLEKNLSNTLSILPNEHADWILNEYNWYYRQFYPEYFI